MSDTTTHLRAAIKRQHLPFTTTQRIMARLDRYDPCELVTDPAESEALNLMIALGVLCCEPGAAGLPDPDWIAAAIVRHIQANPHA